MVRDFSCGEQPSGKAQMTSAMRTALLRASAVALLVCAAGSPSVLLAKTKPAVHHASAKSAKGRHIVKAVNPGFAAREAFYSGDFAKAYDLAPAAGENWIAGLACYRMQN